MRTLHVGLRVSDLDRSLGFYTSVGYEVVGVVPHSPIGRLAMLKLPDDDSVALELVHDPAHGHVTGNQLSHLVIAVESMAATREELAAQWIQMDDPTSPDGSGDFLTAFVTDPDGNRIELVQWPAGHASGMTAEDFAH